jgi:chorismate mutase
MKLNNEQKDQVKVAQITSVIENNAIDTDDLISMLELTVEDLIERFPDRLIDNYEKFIPSGFEDDTMETYYKDQLDETEEEFVD